MRINRNVKHFSTWLTLMMADYDIEDEELSEFLNCNEFTIVGWRGKRNIPKLKYILGIAEFFSIKTGEAPTDIMDELLSSIYQWKQINKRYRERKREEK